jgi:hypothetical protein
MWVPSAVVRSPIFTFLLIAAVGLTGAACSSSESTPPVARVSVSTPQQRVPVGSPLELTFRFEPTGERIEGDYVVFVHFTNADGQVLWTDDHRPVTPTSAWQPGQPVEYTRTVFLAPNVLHPGDVGVDVGLYRDDQRLVLDGSRASRDTSRAYRVVDLQLAPESENVFLIYQTGWHPDEFSADKTGRSWKWMQKSATVTFRHPRADVELLVELGGRPDLFGAEPQQLSVIGANGDTIAAWPVDSAEPVLHRVAVTSAQLGTADLAELRFEVDRSFVPADVGAGSDTRELGARIFNMFVKVR